MCARASLLTYTVRVRVLLTGQLFVPSAITGVEINPYSMTFRDEDWYNAWDVESGVVWEPSTLVSCCRVATRRTDGRYVLGPHMPETLRALPGAAPPAPISGGNE